MIKLAEMAFACYAVPKFESGYQKSYHEFLKTTAPSFNMRDEAHRQALLTWLNKWRCHISEKEFFSEISPQTVLWFEKYENSFPKVTTKLTNMSDDEIDRAATGYEDLWTIHGVGDTVASKILFAIRNEVYPVWDRDMKAHYWQEDCFTYSEYMKRCKRELLDLDSDCQRNGTTIYRLPSLLERQQSSLLKLLDEYHWVFVKNKQELEKPFIAQLQQWCKWTSGSK